jgi:gliding motility-associated-like protein
MVFVFMRLYVTLISLTQFLKPGPGTFITTIILLISLSASGQLTAGFTAAPLSGCAPVYVSFTDQSTGNPVSWQWDLGNGTLSVQQHPTTTYFNSGLYTITLTVKYANGTVKTSSRSQYIRVNDNPVVNFSAQNTIGCFPVRTNFTDLSTPGSGNIVAWAWDFGDGNLSAAQNPSHTYMNAGTYAVTLKVTNSGGCSKIFTRPNFIHVSPGVTAGFSHSLPVGCNPPETIGFTNSTTGPGTLTYEWLFGDGGISASQDPSHNYTAGGSFNVTLIAQSSLGCVDTLIRPAAFTIADVNPDFSGPASVCTGVPAAFQNASVPFPASSSWDFGDGTVSAANNPVKTWTTAGVYSVKLVSNYATCADSVTKIVTVLALPVPNFTASDSIDCDAPFTVNFSDISSGATGWSWDFGDGNTSLLQNPVHTYLANGNYTVKLVITGANGCSDSLVKSNYIKIQRPVTGISGLPLEGCIPFLMNITPNVTAIDGVSSYHWDFGDGAVSSSMNPSHTYPLQGTYKVKLIINTNDGCIDSAEVINAVRTGTKPAAAFTASPLTQCAGQPVNFTNLTVPSDRWLWDFGDGATSAAENPQYAYPDTGLFNISLIAWNNGCRDTLVKYNYVNTLPPVARFSMGFNCNNKKQVVFTDQSASPQAWHWDFGDGNTSVLQHPVHTYASFGTYTVALTVTNGSCTNSRSMQAVLINEQPDFIAVSDTICSAQDAQFNALGMNPSNIATYYWDYGDGIAGTGAAAQGHHYANTGLYTVKLTVTDVRGCITSITKPGYMRVFGPKANFTFNPPAGCEPFQVHLTDLSHTDGIHGIVSWAWNYGDSQLQTYSFPPFGHVYDTTGYFHPYLTVTDSYGCSNDFLSPVPVFVTDPHSAFHSPDTLTCAGATVHFVNSSAGTGLTWSWDFGDGTSSASSDPVKAYAADGQYTITLVVGDVNGCKDSLVLNNYIKVHTASAVFSISDSVSSCAPFEVAFSNTTSYNAASSWDFGDGSFSQLEDPTHYYSSPGTYQAKLVVTSFGGCKDSTYKTVTLYPPDATLTYTPLAGCSPLGVDFHVSTAGPVTYLWDLNDGSTITTTDSNFVYAYLLPGGFVPKVILEDQTGCRIPVEGTDTIYVTKSDVGFAANDSLFCDKGTVAFAESVISNGTINGYRWEFGDGNFSTQQEPVHHYAMTGAYDVQLVVTTQNGCADTAFKSHYIKVVASPVIAIGGNAPICMQKVLNFKGQLLQTDTSLLAWKWDFGNGNGSSLQDPPAQRFNAAGDYPVQLLVLNSSGCADTVNATVTIYPLPQIQAGPDKIIPVGSSVLLSATGSPVINYAWTPATQLSCADCAGPVASPKFNTKYTIKVRDSNGCENTAAIMISVTCSDKNVFIPNTFSPNNDGMNDVFYARGTGLFSIKNMRIFNRWGELVFIKANLSANDPAMGWNGTYRGKKASADVYTYAIDIICENDEVVTYKGNITLIQ